MDMNQKPWGRSPQGICWVLETGLAGRCILPLGSRGSIPVDAWFENGLGEGEAAWS
jgi:hypothetical protein